MRSMHSLTAGVGTGLAFMLAGTVAVHAQTQPGPAYLVVEVNVHDEEGFNEYAEQATETVLQYGGTFIVAGGNLQTVEGPDPIGNIVIIRFGSVEEAQNWLNSPEYTAVKTIRHRTADTRQYLVEGLPQE